MFQNLEHHFSTSVLTKAQSVTCLSGMYSLLGGLPDGSDGEESACETGGPDSIPGSVRSPGGGHGNPFQYSCLENSHRQRSMASYNPWGHKESDTTEWLIQLQFTSIPTLNLSQLQFCCTGGFLMLLCLVDQCVQLSATPWTVAHQAALSMKLFQARILEWVAISSSRGSSWSRDWTHVSCVSCISRQIFYHLGSPN